MDKKVTFTFTVAEVNIVLAGLGKLPLEAGIELFGKIQQEAKNQLESSTGTVTLEPPQE